MRLTGYITIRIWLAIAAMLSSVYISSAQLKVGLVLDRGGKDDKSFNSSAYAGCMKAKSELGVTVKYVEATDDNAFEPLLRGLANRDYDLIIGIGFAQKEAIGKVAAQFPKRNFAIVDAQVDAPNVQSLLFEEQEGAYLVGAIAAMSTKTGKIGFVGGMDVEGAGNGGRDGEEWQSGCEKGEQLFHIWHLGDQI